jgi:hypothetical protein
MDDEPLHEQIDSYEHLSAEIRELTRERESVATAVGDRLSKTLTEAVTAEGANVTAVDRSEDGHRYRFEARLDRAALVAVITERLPAGFVVSHVNDDGSLSVEWTGKRETRSKRQHGAILKAIVAEEMTVDDDGLIESVPTRERVLTRASELGVDEDDAASRLDRLATLKIFAVETGDVYPGENFSRM